VAESLAVAVLFQNETLEVALPRQATKIISHHWISLRDTSEQDFSITLLRGN
jgi:hypothetical protein